MSGRVIFYQYEDLNHSDQFLKLKSSNKMVIKFVLLANSNSLFHEIVLKILLISRVVSSPPKDSSQKIYISEKLEP